jgi:CheY-like chemotaxis protein
MLEDQVFRQQRTSFASQLAMTVAHQLRNPLGVMIGFAEMLSHGMPAEQVPTLIDRIMRNGIRCKEIVQNLLEFGRGAPGEHVRSNINDIVRERVMSLYPASVASRITWRLGEPQPPVEGAPEQLAQVFINLIDNALQAATNQVVFESAACDDTVYVKVWDDGPGVPEAIRPRIFEPFFTTRKEEGGIGLGLSLSRSVVQEHRGLLYLDETASPGACFVIQLPAAESEATRQRARQPPEPARPAGHRILIVEDEPDLVFLLTMALQTHGGPADTAATGAQAVELLQTNVYDAIVIDMLLGDELGGRELYQILLRAYPDLAKRSLFITGDTLKYETRRFLNDTQRPVLEKPFMISDFTRTVSDILGQELGTGR